MKYIHADLITKYAQDCHETATPWLMWQFSPNGIDWMPCRAPVQFCDNLFYRRIPLSSQEIEDGWVIHTTDTCPVDGERFVLVKYADDTISPYIIEAKKFRWSTAGEPADIVAYKIDEYEHLRKAALAGNIVQFMATGTSWTNFSSLDIMSWKPSLPPACYRIVKKVVKPLPLTAFMPGTHLRNEYGSIYIVTSNHRKIFLASSGSLVNSTIHPENVVDWQYIPVNEVSYVNGILQNSWQPCNTVEYEVYS